MSWSFLTEKLGLLGALTPFSHQKYWITNGAVHANWIVVFCQLMVEGVNNGIHGVLVPIRDEDGNTLPGWSLSHLQI